MTRSFLTHLQTNRKPRRTFRPQAEGLEGRQLLTGPGSLDTSFDQDGSALAGSGLGRQVEVQRINNQDLLLVAGDNGGNIRITRLLPNGQIDSSFGSSGSVTLDFEGQEDTVRDLLVLPEAEEKARLSALSQFRGVLAHPSATVAAALDNADSQQAI